MAVLRCHLCDDPVEARRYGSAGLDEGQLSICYRLTCRYHRRRCAGVGAAAARLRRLSSASRASAATPSATDVLTGTGLHRQAAPVAALFRLRIGRRRGRRSRTGQISPGSAWRFCIVFLEKTRSSLIRTQRRRHGRNQPQLFDDVDNCQQFFRHTDGALG